MKKIVTIPSSMDSRKKSWRKLLEKVDTSKSNGYAFIGQWLRAGEKAELPINSYILAYDEPGSMKHWRPYVQLLKVTEEGLETVLTYEGDYHELSWALAVRDDIAKIVNIEEEELTEKEMKILELLKELPEERINIIIKKLTKEE